MSINRRLRRNNNMAGLKAQLADKEKEIYMLAQQHDMQKTYFDEVSKISTALKDIIMKELKIDEEAVMVLLEAELDTKEAAEIDDVIKAEAPSIEIVDDNDEVIDHTITKEDVEANPGEDLKEGDVIGIPVKDIIETPEEPVKEKKPRKKKVSK